MFDIKDFLNRAQLRHDPHFGMIAEFDGKDYEIAPDGYSMVRVVGDDGETLGRITLQDGKFVEA